MSASVSRSDTADNSRNRLANLGRLANRVANLICRDMALLVIPIE